jgi:phosphoenolpyruvate carboxylase
MINAISAYIPARRARKLHIGLFGYSRELDGHAEVRLPRAITFCAALYSIGLPPELLGWSGLTPSEIATVRSAYQHVNQDIGDSLRYLSKANLRYLPDVVRADVETALDLFGGESDAEHDELTTKIYQDIRTAQPSERISEQIEQAAVRRCFLG